MTHASLLVALTAALALLPGARSDAAAKPADFARQEAPLDGWAAHGAGTRGGADADAANVVTVSSAQQLRSALAQGASRIIQVDGVIDMSEGRPFLDSDDQARRGTVRLRSHTTLVGLGPNAGFINANLMVAKVSQVIIRNLNFRNPCDVAPRWDPNDGAEGNWNAEFDAISIVGATHVWIDHNSFTDAPFTDDTLPVEHGKPRQCHDGALDIREASDFVTVSYNRFAMHQKNMLIGASDKAVGDAGHLRVTISNNLFENIASRSPRVRFGQVHLFNNYHLGDRKHRAYQYEYGVGVAKAARIVSHANAFDIAGARGCRDAVRTFDSGAEAGVFSDSGSLLNGRSLAPCALAPTPAFTVPYPFKPRAAEAVRAHVLASAGAGRIGARTAVAGCPRAEFLVCEAFDGPAQAGGGWETVGPKSRAPTLRPETRGLRNRMLHFGAADPSLILSRDPRFKALTSGNAFVEARVRTAPGAASGRQLYLVGRYADPHNWIGAGLNLPASGDTMQVQLVKMQAGVLTPLKNVPRARLMQGDFAMLRFETNQGTLAVYLDGERITTAPDSPFTGRAPANPVRIGLYSQGGAFELDDLRAGVPGVQPSRIAPSLAASNFTAQAGDPPQRIAISAVAADGVTRLGFTARSSDPQVASVSVDPQGITITPRTPGTACILLTASGDPALRSTLSATVGAPFAAPTGPVALGQAVVPAPGSPALPPDTLLQIRFDAPPVLAAGSVRIYRQSDDALVDIIRTGEEVRAIGAPGAARARHVRMQPVTVDGNTVSIRPHSGALAYGSAYYVVVGDGVFAAALGGSPFRGVGKAAGWTFRTTPAAPRTATLTVDDDNQADFRTVQGALNYAMGAFDKAAPVTIDVRNGRYQELLLVLGKDNLHVKGESRDGVVIHATNNDGMNPGSGLTQGAGSPAFSGGRSLLMVEEADLLVLENLTLRNTTLRANTRSGQAETVYFNVDGGRLVAKNASFFSEQDTIQVKGYAWFYRTLIEGNVDFVWGANRAALFEDSELRSVGDSANPASGGYVVQARTVAQDDPGFVFLNSRLTHGPGPKGNDVPPGATWLARSPGTASTWDNVAFIGCRMGAHVAPAGWAGAGVNREPAPNPLLASAAQGWREHGTMDLEGKRLDLSRRTGGYVLGDEEAQQRFGSRAVIFKGFGAGQGWDPAP